MTKHDPIAAALDAIDEPATGGTISKVVRHFGDQPEVLDAIRRARRDRKLSYQQIAATISSTSGHSISSGAIQNWLRSQGIA